MSNSDSGEGSAREVSIPPWTFRLIEITVVESAAVERNATTARYCWAAAGCSVILAVTWFFTARGDLWIPLIAAVALSGIALDRHGRVHKSLDRLTRAAGALKSGDGAVTILKESDYKGDPFIFRVGPHWNTECAEVRRSSLP